MMNSTATDFPLVTLHPVVDARYHWVALLLRSGPATEAESLSRCFGELGVFEALGGLPCIVSLPDPTTCPSELADLLPASQVTLCFPNAAATDPRCKDALTRLRRQGFRLMGNGLPAVPDRPAAEVDSLAVTCAGIEPPPGTQAALTGRPGPHLALAVDSPQCQRNCSAAGFHWFVGNHFIQPQDGPAHGTAHQALVMRLLALVTADADSHQIEAIFKQDVHLSYQLLKLVNSVAFSLRTRITSFHQAITLLGRRQLQRWLQLLLYARAPGADANPLMPLAACRAELMGALCAGQGGDSELQDRAFMVGMFSLLGVLLGLAIRDVIAPLNLADDVMQALSDRSGKLGELLTTVEVAEQGTSPALATQLETIGIHRPAWVSAQAQAYRWAIQVSREA